MGEDLSGDDGVNPVLTPDASDDDSSDDEEKSQHSTGSPSSSSDDDPVWKETVKHNEANADEDPLWRNCPWSKAQESGAASGSQIFLLQPQHNTSKPATSMSTNFD